MKNLFLRLALAISGLILLFGCNNDDDMIPIQQEFLSASVDGEEFMVNGPNPIVKCQKRITEFGTINLSVKVETEEGKTIEFLIINYLGNRNYPIGNLNSPENNTLLNGNWMNYTETSPQGFWSTNNKNVIGGGDFLEITEDDGIYLSGSFSFVATDNVGESLRSVSDGNFKIKIDM